MSGAFYPPPPVFIGGTQPYAPQALDQGAPPVANPPYSRALTNLIINQWWVPTPLPQQAIAFAPSGAPTPPVPPVPPVVQGGGIEDDDLYRHLIDREDPEEKRRKRAQKLKAERIALGILVEPTLPILSLPEKVPPTPTVARGPLTSPSVTKPKKEGVGLAAAAPVRTPQSIAEEIRAPFDAAIVEKKTKFETELADLYVAQATKVTENRARREIQAAEAVVKAARDLEIEQDDEETLLMLI